MDINGLLSLDLLQVLGVVLTVMILLYLIVGDNALFRLVTYTFIGITSGYVAVLLIFQVLIPRIAILLVSDQLALVILGLVELLLGSLLFFQLWRRTSAIGAPTMAILVGVGAAVAIGGSIFGTLFGQIGGSSAIFDLSALQPGENPLLRLGWGIFVLAGAVCTLAYFQFSARSRAAAPAPEGAPARRAAALELLAQVGQGFIGITLGSVFAGVFTAAITALVERIGFLYNFVAGLFS
jgi:hypothetical protein